MEEAQEKIGGTLGEEFGEEPVCMFILFQCSSVLLGSLLLVLHPSGDGRVAFTSWLTFCLRVSVFDALVA